MLSAVVESLRIQVHARSTGHPDPTLVQHAGEPRLFRRFRRPMARSAGRAPLSALGRGIAPLHLGHLQLHDLGPYAGSGRHSLRAAVGQHALCADGGAPFRRAAALSRLAPPAGCGGRTRIRSSRSSRRCGQRRRADRRHARQHGDDGAHGGPSRLRLGESQGAGTAHRRSRSPRLRSGLSRGDRGGGLRGSGREHGRADPDAGRPAAARGAQSRSHRHAGRAGADAAARSGPARSADRGLESGRPRGLDPSPAGARNGGDRARYRSLQSDQRSARTRRGRSGPDRAGRDRPRRAPRNRCRDRPSRRR